MLKIKLRPILATVFTACAALSVMAQSNQEIEFTSVKEALDALVARKTLNVSQQGGWTIINDRAQNTIWSFTPSSHPAHPAVVKRTIVSDKGQLGVQMNALCEAQKVACDDLMAEFTAMNKQMATDIQSRSNNGAAFTVQVAGSNPDKTWQPVASDTALLEKKSMEYFAAKDAGRHQNAYAMYDTSFKQKTTFEQWQSVTKESGTKLGADIKRSIKRLVWYKDPAGATPGVYAAMDFSGVSANVDIYCGYIVWKQQGDATYALVREEQNFIDKETEKKLSPSDLEKTRIQMGC
jgi:Protein of unknown function (DUF4019)